MDQIMELHFGAFLARIQTMPEGERGQVLQDVCDLQWLEGKVRDCLSVDRARYLNDCAGLSRMVQSSGPPPQIGGR